MKLKKIFVGVLITGCLMSVCLTGCGKSTSGSSDSVNWNKMSDEYDSNDNAEDVEDNDENNISDLGGDVFTNNNHDTLDDTISGLKEYVNSSEFQNVSANEQMDLLYEKLAELAAYDAIRDDYEYNSDNNSYSFSTKGGLLYEVSANGVHQK